ncbi:hypothetical protein [Providencia hangzhouensis]|uniref:hypothetical protein n=1 Tax=Providencia hangzhouensis TaxID=3031799 RepID=UPI0034DCCEA0
MFFFIANTSQASGISVGGTRFVYEENKREIDIPIFNSDKEKPFLIQKPGITIWRRGESTIYCHTTIISY